MRIDACLIVEGDEKFEKLVNAVHSVRDYVTQVHVTTNGKEVARTKAWCEGNGVDYSHLDWNDDFAAQRNFNFARAKFADYIFWLDSDDVLVGGEHLAKIADRAKQLGVNTVFLTYWYSCLFSDKGTVLDVDLEQMRERLIDPKTMRWVGRLHETPIELDGVNYKHTTIKYDEKDFPIVVIHTSCQPDESREKVEARTERNRRILEAQLKDEREGKGADPRTILYLMKIYAELSDLDLHKQNLLMGKEYLDKSGWDEERNTCWLLMAKSASKLGAFEESYKFCLQALKEFPGKVETLLRLSEAAFETKRYREMKVWLDMALSQENEETTSGITNNHFNKILAAEMTCRYFWDVKRNLHKAYRAAKQVADLNPNPATLEREETLRQLANLDSACEHADKLCRYLVSSKQEKAVFGLLQSLPQSIKEQPFALNYIKKYSEPKKWGSNEICYFANYGGPSIEPWSPNSLRKGIGGSETAVIELARQWVKDGYKVTVYGDPGDESGVHEGVNYVPWFYFNPKDNFNIFIQWRSNSLAGKISCKKYYVDLHDVVYPTMFDSRLEAVDKIMVKSLAHRKLLKSVPDEKILIISNGVEI